MLKTTLMFLVLILTLSFYSLPGSAQCPYCGRTNCSGGCGMRGQPVFIAVSVCPITGVVGRGRGYTQDAAITVAVRDCIYRGGVPDCCRHNVEFE